MDSPFFKDYFENGSFERDFNVKPPEVILAPDEVRVNEVKMDHWSVKLSEALSAFNVFGDNVKAAMWEVGSQPTSLFVTVLETFVHTDVCQEIKKSNIRPVAHSGLVDGTATLVTIKDSDQSMDLIEKVLLKMTDEYSSPDVPVQVITDHGVETRAFVNSTVLNAHFVQSMFLSASRISLGFDLTKSRYLDLCSGIDVSSISFSNFSMIKDRFSVIPDMFRGLTVAIPEDPIATHQLHAKLDEAMQEKKLIKTAFRPEDFDVWKEFLFVMNENREGFSNLLLCINYPFVIDFMIQLYKPLPLIESFDCELPEKFVSLMREDCMEAPDIDETSELIMTFQKLTDKISPESLGVQKKDYGACLYKDPYPHQDILNEALDKIDDKLKCQMSSNLFSLSSSVTRASELLRVIRAQDEYQRDEKTNRSADVFQGDYEQLYFTIWRKNCEVLANQRGLPILIIGDSSAFPFLHQVVDLNGARTGDFLALEEYDVDYHSERHIYIDFMTDKFDSMDDVSIPTRFNKTWLKAFPSQEVLVSIFARFSLLKRKIVEPFKKKDLPVDIVLRLPMPSSEMLVKIYCLIPKSMNMGFHFIPAKKAHDPFFYLRLTSTPHKFFDEERHFVTKFCQLMTYFLAGVYERHRAWEENVDMEQMRLYRSKQWLELGYKPTINLSFKPTEREYTLVATRMPARKAAKKLKEDNTRKRIELNNALNTLLQQEGLYSVKGTSFIDKQ